MGLVDTLEKEASASEKSEKVKLEVAKLKYYEKLLIEGT